MKNTLLKDDLTFTDEYNDLCDDITNALKPIFDKYKDHVQRLELVGAIVSVLSSLTAETT